MATEFNISDAMQVPLKTTGLPSLISEIMPPDIKIRILWNAKSKP
jgi:hypothetical protein